ncbi:hypothetical protein N7457_005499 [Penicillium paradoxum]|uniref:uncharacterized protein n=1 Tax=Penicillium paradoxum TaxID=176176 RepID=UPI0025470BD6|nr:uncharacterized protein N7457_005499 [Penicillium paradoxum]KAJ5780339.1 hypothetical protein N7457_005499 [Penicillium paradoxum]
MSGRSPVPPGNYIVLASNQTPVSVSLTTECAPRRVKPHDTSTESQGRKDRDDLQEQFRDSLRRRDGCCALTGPPQVFNNTRPFRGLESTHIFPVSLLEEWNRGNYSRYVTDPSPASVIGASKMFSPQNGLLLRSDLYSLFDDFETGAGFKIIIFSSERGEARLGGTRLRDSARSGSQGVNADLLRWHLRMCLYRNLKTHAEPQILWEEDIGEDSMGTILAQPDAAARMEAELFTRLGSMIA